MRRATIALILIVMTLTAAGIAANVLRFFMSL